MDPQNPAPGDTPAAPPTATPAAPAANEPAPSAQPSQPSPTGSEPENNPSGSGDPAMVPSDRLREETEKRRKAEEELQTFREAEAQRQQQAAPSGDDDELDPEVEDLIRKGAKKLGLVSKDDLEGDRLREQVRRDVTALESQYANTGVPYDHNAILDYAAKNNLPITSKAALEAAYRTMNWDKLVEVERQRAIASAHDGGGSGAELPGSSGGAQPPSEPEVKGRNPRERGVSRIRAARQKLTSS